jgi:VWFA-related protein
LIAVACVLATCSSQVIGAQEIPAPTIRVTTHMVLVDVVVTDKQGKPVPGLRAEDFAIEEKGKAQKIASFTTTTEGATPPEPLPPGIYSNRAQYRSPGGPTAVLLLDGLNTVFKDQAYARLQMLKFVQQQFRSGQRMAVFTLTRQLGVLQDFTSDPRVLNAALQHYQPSETVAALDPAATPIRGSVADSGPGSGTAMQSAVAVAQQALASFAGAEAAYDLDKRVQLTLTALNSIARILGGLPGRKSIIWVTGAFPFTLIPEDRTVTEEELSENLPGVREHSGEQRASGNYAATSRTSYAQGIRETSARLASAQVSIYPVDARGLSISTDTDSIDTMREMARETGGRAYVNQNEIREGVAQAFADQSAVYTIGYYPENKKYDGQYRSIKVKVNKAGTDIFHRRGYYAIDPTQLQGYNPNQEVAAALGDALPSTLVAFRAQVKSPDDNSSKGKIGVTFLVDTDTLSAEEVSGGKHMSVVFYATLYSRDGKMLADHNQRVDQVFKPDVYQQVLQRGMMLHMDLDPVPGAAEVRLAVQDGRTGMVGTVDAPTP